MHSKSGKKSGFPSQQKPSTTNSAVDAATDGVSVGAFDGVEQPRAVDADAKTPWLKSCTSSASKTETRIGKTSLKKARLRANGEIAFTLGKEDTIANCSSKKEELVVSKRALRGHRKEEAPPTSKVRASRKKQGRSAFLGTKASEPGVEFICGEAKTGRDYVVRTKDPRPAATRKFRRSLRDGNSPSSTTFSTNRDCSDPHLRRDSRRESKALEADNMMAHLAQIIEDDKELRAKKENAEQFRPPLRPSDPLIEGHSPTNPFFHEPVSGSAPSPDYDYEKVDGGFGDIVLEEGDDGVGSVMVPIEGEVFYHATAIQYDPDAKPPLHKNRRFQLYIISVILILLIITVGAVVGTVASRSVPLATYAPTLAPSAAPSTHVDSTYSRQFTQSVGIEVDIPGTPAYKAAEWIMTKDPRKLPPNAPNLLQRFILANFYFATSQNKGGWRSCGAPEDGGSADCIFQKLERLKDDSLVYDQMSATRWLSASHECEWVGIQCDDLLEVAAVEVWGQNLTGTVPAVLTELTLLRRLSLPFNDLGGQIPSELARMRHLVSLELHENDLTGTIPDEYWDINALQVLNVGGNRINGTLSPDVAKLTDLKGLHLYENELTGPFPVNVPANLQFLSYMRINDNQFTGTFHTEFGKLTLLKELWYHSNVFTGAIPTEVGMMASMMDLRVHDNAFRGTIPEEVYSLTELFRLDISGMLGIVGTISTQIGNLLALERLGLQMNSLTGTVPTEMGLCSNLVVAWFHLNELSGSMPLSVCRNRRTVGPGNLEVLQADCLGITPLPPPFECDPDCCTACCERDYPQPVCRFREQPK